MVSTYTRENIDKIPNAVRAAVISWGDDVVIFDETQLTPAQEARLIKYLKSKGYDL